ncbi:MAG: response regulator [Planctomycetota bacterium]|nr:response regulator [Planctomycetota bacterium]
MPLHDDSAKPHGTIDTVRLRPRECENLINSLKQSGPTSAAAEARRWRRFVYDAEFILVSISHPGGSTENYQVTPRNLSVGGMAFIHGQFVHLKSKCRVTFPTKTGEWFRVPGKVVRCRHIEGMIHDVSVAFDERIDPVLFVGSDAPLSDNPVVPAEAPAGSGKGEAAGAAKMRATVLVADSVQDHRAMLGKWLRQQGMTVVDAADEVAAMEWVEKREATDLVLLHLAEDSAQGCKLIRRIRKHGYVGAILVISSDGSNEVKAQAIAAGATLFLAKPCDQPTFSKALMQLLTSDMGAAASKEKPDAKAGPAQPDKPKPRAL